jgi:hypothetical protein
MLGATTPERPHAPAPPRHRPRTRQPGARSINCHAYRRQQSVRPKPARPASWLSAAMIFEVVTGLSGNVYLIADSNGNSMP